MRRSSLPAKPFDRQPGIQVFIGCLTIPIFLLFLAALLLPASWAVRIPSAAILGCFLFGLAKILYNRYKPSRAMRRTLERSLEDKFQRREEAERRKLERIQQELREKQSEEAQEVVGGRLTVFDSPTDEGGLSVADDEADGGLSVSESTD